MFEMLAHKDRTVAFGALSIVAALSWAYVLSGAGMDMAMSGGPGMEALHPGWSPGYAALIFVMWWVMMIAMMLPGAAPMILLFATVGKSSAQSNAGAVPTLVFVAGYLMVWGGFSLFATMVQWWLSSIDLLDMMMRATVPWLGGLLLIAAGLYQFTALKDACLRHCQSPVQFVMGHWQPGPAGAFRMGLLHGTFCLGCCWVLMGLLFFGGVMSIAWIGALAAYVLIEKLAPRGMPVGKIAGLGLIVWGGTLVGSATIPH